MHMHIQNDKSIKIHSLTTVFSNILFSAVVRRDRIFIYVNLYNNVNVHN